MAIKLVPYNNAMRLGQGFNSYTQQICIDDAVVIDSARAENVVTNDGTTMRIIAERSALPSAWSRQPEVITDNRADKPIFRFKLGQKVNELEEQEGDDSKGEQPQDEKPKDDEAKDDEPEDDNAKDDEPQEDEPRDEESKYDLTAREPTDGGLVTKPEAGGDADISDKGEESEEKQAASGAKMAAKEVAMDSDSGEHIMHKELDEPVHQATKAATGEERIEEVIDETSSEEAIPVPEVAKKPSDTSNARKSPRSSSPVPVKSPVSRPILAQKLLQRAANEIRAEKARKREEEKKLEESLRKEKEELRKAEAKRSEEQRRYEEEVAKEEREEERARRKDERAEQQAIRAEKRDFNAKRRADARKAIEAAAVNLESTKLEDLKKIAAKNQFAERFVGMLENQHQYTFDPAGGRGPSQTVTYVSRFVERLSDVTEDMCISGSLSIKAGKIGGSGKGSFVDSDKFKESDLNFYISVKVVNQTVNFKDALVYNPVRSVNKDNFKEVFGDSFISGFVEGGEFNALVSMKILNKAKKTDIQAEAKVALTTGSVNVDADANVGIARANLETNTETTIQVAWSGGGHIKPMEQQWDINSLMEAAARFPDLVADCPQRIYAVLTKYDTLRSFLALKPEGCSPLQYENARIYTNALLDYYMSYKALYKQLGEQIFRVDAGTLEILPWAESAAQATTASASATKGEKDKNTGLYPYVEDPTHFEASIEGLSDARTAIRRQMARIVNEVDLIEQSPKYATDEDHKEPFQVPITFTKRIPKVDLLARLKRHTLPLSGQAITNQKLTEDQQMEELQRQAELDDAPYLYGTKAALTTKEKVSFDKIRDGRPGIGLDFRVTGTVGSDTEGKPFNNLDTIQLPVVWEVVSIRVHVYRGFISYVGVKYDNGTSIGRGVKHNDANSFNFGPFSPGEHVVSASIETGVRSSEPEKPKEQPRVLAVGLFTNRGRAFLASAHTERKSKDKYSKDGVLFEKLEVTYFDRPLDNGTFKGFFGRSDDDISGGGAIWKLGVIWGTASNATTTNIETMPLSLSSVASIRSDSHSPQGGTIIQPNHWDSRNSNALVRRVIQFSPPYSEPPLLISGIRHLEINPHTAINAEIRHSDETRAKADVVLRTNGHPMNEFDMCWLSIPKTDKHIETGVYEFVGDERQSEDQGWVSRKGDVAFPTPFLTPPKCVMWLCNIVDAENDDRFSASCWIENVTTEAMTVQCSRLAVCGPEMAGSRVGYLCYDESECANIQTGIIMLQKGTAIEERRFKFPKEFKTSPVVFLALRYMEAGVHKSLRITGGVWDVNENGFNYYCGSWPHGWETEMRELAFTWIAVA